MIKSKFFWPGVFALLSLVAFFVYRLLNLNVLPVFVDEAIYVRWSQVMKAEATLRFLPLSDGKQPLAMWLTIPFFKVITDPLIAGRLVSVIAGLGSLVGVGLLSFLLFNNLFTASLTIFLYAILPFSVFFDRMALADSLLNMFGLWTLCFSFIFARSRRLDHAMILGFIIGGGLITKSPATIFYFWLALGLVFFSNFFKLNLSQKKDLLIGMVAIVIISQGIYSVLRLGPGFNMIGSRNQDYVFSFKEVLNHPLNPLVGNLKSSLNWFWVLFTPPLFLSLFLSFLPRKNYSQLFFVLFACLAPLFGQAAIAKVYTSRYILYAAIPLITLIGYGLGWLLENKKAYFKFFLVFITFPLYLSYQYVFDPVNAKMTRDMRSGYLEEWTAGWGNREVTNYFISLNKQGRKVVAFTEGYFGTMPDGLQIYTEGYPNINIVGSPPQVMNLPEGLLNSDKNNANFFVVNKSRNLLSSSNLNKLNLVQEFTKPQRPDGTQEVLQLFQLK